MRVTIEHLTERQYTRRGWFRDKLITVQGIFVKLLIELTDDERSVLDQHKLWDKVISEMPDPAYDARYAEYLFFLKHTKPGQPGSWAAKHPSPPPEPPDKNLKCTIRSYCNPDGFTRQFASLGEAKNWAHSLRDELQVLKDLIQHNSTPPPQRETFDL
jgi:hypothetical protein